jgi:hypothetical protein
VHADIFVVESYGQPNLTELGILSELRVGPPKSGFLREMPQESLEISPLATRAGRCTRHLEQKKPVKYIFVLNSWSSFSVYFQRACLSDEQRRKWDLWSSTPSAGGACAHRPETPLIVCSGELLARNFLEVSNCYRPTRAQYFDLCTRSERMAVSTWELRTCLCVWFVMCVCMCEREREKYNMPPWISHIMELIILQIYIKNVTWIWKKGKLLKR